MYSHLILVELTSLGIHSVTISIFPCSESSRKILWCKLHQSCIKHILWSIKYTHLTCLPLICAKYLTHKQTSQGYFHSAISQQYRSLEQYPVSIENNHITHQENSKELLLCSKFLDSHLVHPTDRAWQRTPEDPLHTRTLAWHHLMQSRQSNPLLVTVQFLLTHYLHTVGWCAVVVLWVQQQ